MRSVFCVLTLLAATAMPAHARAAEPPKPPASEPIKADEPELTHKQKLDKMFAELKREKNPGAAKRIAGRIQQEWANSGSASIDLMVGWAKTATEKKQYDVALDFLDQAVVLDPDYAEAYNRRAGVHFAMHNFAKAMTDIDQTLRLEPRHFGAMSGIAQIMQARGNKELALEAYTRVLAVYPMDRSTQNQVSTISEELAGESI